MVLLISYDLNGKERPSSYTAVADIIKKKAKDYKKPLYSQWFVETDETPDQWQSDLKPAIDANDKLFIVQVRRPYQGWLGKEVWAWLRTRV